MFEIYDFLFLQSAWDPTEICAGRLLSVPFLTAALSVPAPTMAFVATPSPTVVDQTTLMKKYLQFVAALTDANTRKFIDPHSGLLDIRNLDRCKKKKKNSLPKKHLW